jgi:hypothetical protein
MANQDWQIDNRPTNNDRQNTAAKILSWGECLRNAIAALFAHYPLAEVGQRQI